MITTQSPEKLPQHRTTIYIPQDPLPHTWILNFFLNWQRTAGKEHQNLGEVNYIQFLQQYILYINILNSSLQLLQKSPICFHQKKS